jgi:hypothetical protein
MTLETVAFDPSNGSALLIAADNRIVAIVEQASLVCRAASEARIRQQEENAHIGAGNRT